MANPEVRDCNVLQKKELLPLGNSKSKDRTTEKVHSLANSKSKGNFVTKELPSPRNSKSKQRTTPKVQPLGNRKSKIAFTLAIYKRLNLFSTYILPLAIYKSYFSCPLPPKPAGFGE